MLFDFLQLSPHAFADGLPPHGEVAVPVFPADVRKAQEVNRLWFPFSSLFPVLFGKSPELDQSRFVRVKLQAKLLQALFEVTQKTFCVRSTLKTQYAVVGVPNDDDVALPPLLAPGFHPEIENIVQIDIGKQRLPPSSTRHRLP